MIISCWSIFDECGPVPELPNVLRTARVSRESSESYVSCASVQDAELHEFSRASYVEFVRVFQSVLRLHVVRVVPERHTGPASSCASFPERLASSCCVRFPDQDRKGKSNDGFVLYSRLRATSTHQR